MNVRPDRYVLVTGAGGFIGKPVVERLLQRGWLVKAMVRSAGASPIPSHSNLEIVHGDMRNAAAATAAWNHADTLEHLAAAMRAEKLSADVNIGSTQRLVQGCRATNFGQPIDIGFDSLRIKCGVMRMFE